MIIFDMIGNVVENPDLDSGFLIDDVIQVTHNYVIDKPEKGHWETIVEYPNGGKDVKWVVDVPEESHWETRYLNGEIVELFDGEVDEALPKDEPTETIWPIRRYVKYSQEEIAQNAKDKADSQAIVAAQDQIQVAACMFAAFSTTFTDEQARSINMLFPNWTIGNTYDIGQICRYNGYLYRALQYSVAQATHEPNVAVSLWKKIDEANEEGVHPWSQPLGATDTYNTGNKVTHKEKTWECMIDYNAWEPGVYGWQEV